MAQRVIPIKLNRPRFDPTWEDRVRSFIREHRPGLLADIRNSLEQAPYSIDPQTRWATWERDVLGKFSDHDALQVEIRERQRAMDDDEDERSIILEFIKQKIELTGRNPDTCAVLITAHDMAGLISEATRTKYPTNRASALLANLSLPNLRKSDRNGTRNWLWTGDKWIGDDTVPFHYETPACPPPALPSPFLDLSDYQAGW
jgi:hypothetical protein